MMTYETKTSSPRVECLSSEENSKWSHNSFSSCQKCNDLGTVKHEEIIFSCTKKRDIIYRQECVATCKTNRTILAMGSNSYIYAPPGM